ncbi:Hypothetical predicted protein [Mytilus galloprovincialis]|uniref:Uncharacterized protein n=1 Tax=Mytilus galloprovincialis TaxID=29158 RepID=A0A8B6GTX2_MYTGA|nr:Hypothetical predicted protein [Mytilus galloprovincialis]
MRRNFSYILTTRSSANIVEWKRRNPLKTPGRASIEHLTNLRNSVDPDDMALFTISEALSNIEEDDINVYWIAKKFYEYFLKWKEPILSLLPEDSGDVVVVKALDLWQQHGGHQMVARSDSPLFSDRSPS